MLTHEQAAFLRFVRDNDVSPNDTRFDWRPLSDAEFLDDRTELHPWCDFEVRADGEGALAEYDAHYTTIERAELERLQGLERKIEAFMASLELIGCHEDIVIDAGNVTLQHRYYEELGSSDWGVDAHNMLGSDADTFRAAIRQAFELFEVPVEDVKL